MKITILSDNECESGRFLTEHGFSCWIETERSGGDRANILFDMGAGDLFLANAARLGLDMRTAHYAVLSHGHYDHGGGIAPLFKEAPHTRIHLSSRAFEPHLRGEAGEKYYYSEKNVGLNSTLITKGGEARFHMVEGETLLEEGIFLLPAAPPAYPLPPNGSLCMVDKKKRLVPDDFEHEIYLAVREGGQTVLFTGCAHRGIANIAAMVRSRFPDSEKYAIVGGFHIKSDESDEQIGFLEELTRGEPEKWSFVSGHCSGREKVERLRARLSSSVTYGFAGSILYI